MKFSALNAPFDVMVRARCGCTIIRSGFGLNDMFKILSLCAREAWIGMAEGRCGFTDNERERRSGFLSMAEIVEDDPLANGLEDRFAEAS